MFSCSNGYFSGQAEIYVGREHLSKLADVIRDFPSQWDEMESVALRIPIQAAAVDNFAKQLRNVSKEIGEAAYLRSAMP
jgi:hypothetical protein